MNYKIPLYSKNPRYTGLPMYYDKAKDVYTWVDGKKCLDMCHHLGTNPLGYANSYVNHHVKKTINNGNMSMLNNRIQGKVSNLLLSIHNWADTVRFARTGGEAMKLALDLSLIKASNNVISVGYNGWHIKSFDNGNEYNKVTYVDTLNELYKSKRPDILVFELIRHEHPKKETIDLLKEWQRQGTILVIDEITSGFRFNFGGAHLLYDLEPDICVFSKGISNGFPFACVVGKEKYMESDLWISSTYWTESIGDTAAYYTLKMLKQCNYKLLEKSGKLMMSIWESLAKKHGLKIDISDVPNIAHFEFDYVHGLLMKNIFIEKMLEAGVIASDQFYPMFAHKAKHFDVYRHACDKAFKFLATKNISSYKPKNRIQILNK